MAEEILVFAEHYQGDFHPVVNELMVEATKLEKSLDAKVGVLVLSGIRNVPELFKLGEWGAQVIYHVCQDSLDEYAAEVYLQVLKNAVSQLKPGALLFGETPMGSELSRRLAVQIGASFVPDYTRIQTEANRYVLNRLMYQGKIGATVLALKKPLVATLSPGAVGLEKHGSPGAGKVQQLTIDLTQRSGKVHVLERFQEDAGDIDVTEAEIVIGAGRGVGSDAGFSQVEELAKIVGASVGGTRRAVDRGWISSEKLIGQTGKRIAPSVYLAIGVSGASHHVGGIRDAKRIIALNIDRNAPIFKLADLGVASDAQKTLAALIKRIKEMQVARNGHS